MAVVGLNFTIDLKKIDQSRCVTGKNGEKYCNLTTFIKTKEADKYGNNGFITQTLTQEEREAKGRLPILGNTRVFYEKESKPPGEWKPKKQEPEENKWQDGTSETDDDIPF